MNSEPYRSRSLAPGIIISLLVHAGLAALLLSQRPVPHANQPTRWIEVSLLPTPAPRPLPALPEAPPVPPPAPAIAARAKPAAQPKTIPPLRRSDQQEQESVRDTAAITMLPAPAGEAPPPDPFATPPAQPAGRFDATAALRSARKLATAKAGKDDPAVAQLQDKPARGLAMNNELGKGIKQATRPDCLTSGAGAGILAPLLIAAQVLTDKKDHGCKW